MLGDRYRLLQRLSGGGSAVVWRAHYLVLGRTVAVKVLAGREPTSDVNRRQMYDEARTAAALSHPHVAQVHHFGESVEDGQRIPTW